MDGAQRWIGLSDGGSGLEDWLGTNFGRLDAVILDFYHASEHLRDLAKAVHGAGTEAAVACHAAVVPPAQARGGPGDAGRVAGPDPARRRIGPRGLARRR